MNPLDFYLKRFAILLLVFCASIGHSHAQISFQKTYGGPSIDGGASVKQTSDGGYIITGRTSSFGSGLSDVYFIKTSPTGDTLWTKTFGGANTDEGASVQQTSDGGYIIAGSTSSFGAGFSDVYLIKTNSHGDTVWTRTFGDENHDFGYSVEQTYDGGFIVAGFTTSFGSGNYDALLIKTNPSGDTLWSRTYGGANAEKGLSVQQTSDGGYIVAGSTTSYGAGYEDLYMIKTNSSGDTLWTKAYGGTHIDEGRSVHQTSDGGYIVAGYTFSYGVGGSDVYLVRTSPSGETLWTRTYGGAGTEAGSAVRQTSDGGYIVTGHSSSFSAYSAVYLIKTNSTGDTLWTRIYGGTNIDRGSSVQQTSDGGYITAGTVSSFGAGASDVYLIKTLGDGTTSVLDDRTIRPSGFVLFQNYPNPFNPCTTIRFRIGEITHQTSEVSRVTLKVYDVLGREVATLADEFQEAGDKSVVWNATGVPSGVYFYRLQVGTFSQTKRLIMLK